MKKNTSAGIFGVDINVTKVFSFDIQESADGATIDALGTRNFFNFARSNQELKGNARFFWSNINQNAAFTVRYIDSYTNDGLAVPEAINSHTTVDFQYGYSFQSGLSFTAGAINLTDEEPPSVETNFGFDTQTHDPRGRIYYLRMKKTFQ